MTHVQNPGVIIVTGAMASGKSTIAERLAEKFERAVHLRGDTFRRMIVRGREELLPDASEKALAQLELRYRLSASAAAAYAAAGFQVVLQDIIIGPHLQNMGNFLKGVPVYIVVLTPNPEALHQREALRNKKGYGIWSPEELDRRLREETPRIGLWLDTSDLTIEQTVDVIWERIWSEGKIEGE
ncbi:phosphotransferase [Paenibacillus ihbetae]|uniref:Phosphotransferase n=1 Tax=Paenibacillus ihbetae TaxID=1870820 RepID=A0A1B2E721_9BACL|nr:AAA family ATPase [Paenibacillus ihbetae]ANY75780.1 phosphotransferase [Paenibacillus ihbetae]